jgi:plastocyanin
MKSEPFSRWNRMGAITAAGGALVALATLMITGCTTAPPPQEGVTDVAMRGIAFDPKEVTIKVGEGVRWTNFDLVLHTATSGNPGDADAGSVFDTGDLSSGQSSSVVTFDTAGEYVYFCRHHPTTPAMVGAKVIVVP